MWVSIANVKSLQQTRHDWQNLLPSGLLASVLHPNSAPMERERNFLHNRFLACQGELSVVDRNSFFAIPLTQQQVAALLVQTKALLRQSLLRVDKANNREQ